MIFTLNRLFTGTKGTFGDLTDGIHHWATCELPWNNGNNTPGQSCILPCACTVPLAKSGHFGFMVPRLPDMNGRTLIEMHPANWDTQLLGCIGLGKGIGMVEGQLGVYSSDVAFNEFMQLINGQPFALSINNLF